MIRSLPPLSMSPHLEARAPSPLPPLGHDISRPSSTSTVSSNALRHTLHQQPNNTGVSLPALSTLASVAAAPTPQRPYSGIHSSLNYATASPTPTTVGGQGNSPPVCQNCKTSTTPLWRRDEIGSVLCNACGLFLKLHGRPRPISLKTDVIKSRNRVKSSGSAPKKKSVFGANGGPRSEAGTPPPDHRRISLKSSGASDRSNSPISRTGTPSLHQRPNIGQPQLFDHARHQESAFTHSSSLPALQLLQPSSGSNIAPHDRHLEPPQPYESLHHANTTLKTQVSELEVINGLYKGRVQELERAEVTQSQLRKALEQSQAREIELKKRVEDLEREVLMLRREGTSVQHQHPQEYSRPPQYLPQQQKRRLDDESAGNLHPEKSPPSTKRSRLSDVSDFANQTLPTTTTS